MRHLYWYLIEASNDNENWVKIKKFISFRTKGFKKIKTKLPYRYWRIVRWR